MAKKKINHEAVSRAEGLVDLLKSFDTEIDALRTFVNEMRTDHATFKTAADNVETLIEELHDDHATYKTAVDGIETLVEELHDDHATMLTALGYMSADQLVTSAELAIGSTVQNVASLQFSFIINGKLYTKAAVAAGTAPGNDVIPQNTYGAVAFDIGADLTIDAVEAADNATGYGSALLAAAGLPAVAADHARIGYVTAMKSDGTFTFGTTALNAANTTVAYSNLAGLFYNVGGSLPTSLTAPKPASAPATLAAAKPASAPATLAAAAVTEQVESPK